MANQRSNEQNPAGASQTYPAAYQAYLLTLYFPKNKQDPIVLVQASGNHQCRQFPTLERAFVYLASVTRPGITDPAANDP